MSDVKEKRKLDEPLDQRKRRLREELSELERTEINNNDEKIVPILNELFAKPTAAEDTLHAMRTKMSKIKMRFATYTQIRKAMSAPIQGAPFDKVNAFEFYFTSGGVGHCYVLSISNCNTAAENKLYLYFNKPTPIEMYASRYSKQVVAPQPNGFAEHLPLSDAMRACAVKTLHDKSAHSLSELGEGWMEFQTQLCDLAIKVLRKRLQFETENGSLEEFESRELLNCVLRRIRQITHCNFCYT